MEIYEKIFQRLNELHMTQTDLSKRTGISTSTIHDWKKKKINPQSDKLVSVCKALKISLAELLDDEERQESEVEYSVEEKYLIECYRNSSVRLKRRMLQSMELLLEINAMSERNISVIQDVDGRNIVVINDILFKGRRSIEWRDVETYLKKYIGEFYQITETMDFVYIGTDLPGEYAGSVYTKKLKGTAAKAKANAVQGIPELLEFANKKKYEDNRKNKHSRDAKNGWYQYETRFALPVYDEEGGIERYNILAQDF